MRVSDECLLHLARLLEKGKLYIKHPYTCSVVIYFPLGSKIHTGIVTSVVEGEAGIITRVWGVTYIDSDKVLRCTDIHTSYYGESVALNKLLDKLKLI